MDGHDMHEGAVLLTFDFDTMAAWMGSFKATTPGILSRGEFGGRVGIYRILDVLDRYESPTAYLGDRDGERAMYERGIEALERVAGVRPVGYRSPGWDLTAHSIGL